MFGDKTFRVPGFYMLSPTKSYHLFLPQHLHEPHHDERQHSNHRHKNGERVKPRLLPPAQLFLHWIGHSHAVSPYNGHRVMSPPVFVPVLRHNLVNIHSVAFHPLIDEHAVMQVHAVTQPPVNVHAVNTHRRHGNVPRRCATEQQRQYRTRQQSPKQAFQSVHTSDALVFILCIEARAFLYPFPTVNLPVAVGVRTDVAVSQYLSLRITAFQQLQQLSQAVFLRIRPVVHSLAAFVNTAHVSHVYGRRVVAFHPVAYELLAQQLGDCPVSLYHIVITRMFPSFPLELRLQVRNLLPLASCRTVHEYPLNASHCHFSLSACFSSLVCCAAFSISPSTLSIIGLRYEGNALVNSNRNRWYITRKAIFLGYAFTKFLNEFCKYT